MANKDERIKLLLGSGLKAEIVASTVGVDPSYISQLMAIEEFADEVILLRSKNAVAHTERDLSWDGLEDKLISQLHDMVDDGRFSKPEQVLMAVRVANGAVRRGQKIAPDSGPSSVVVNLQLPPVVKHLFTLTNKGEVVDVNGQTMITMGSGQLIEQISKQKGETDEGNFTKLGKSLLKVG